MFGQFLVAWVHQFGPLSVAPQVPYYVKDFNRPPEDILNFIGVFTLVLGFSALVWVPFSTKYGRRPVLLATTCIGIGVALWRALATSYESMLAASAIHGLACGASQTIPASIVSDVMFLHERGVFMGLFAFSLFGGLTLGGVVSGTMTQKYGWRSFWWLDFGLYIFLLLWVIFLMPETKWHRKPILSEAAADTTIDKNVEGEKDAGDNKHETAWVEMASNEEGTTHGNHQDDFLYKGKPSKSQYAPYHNDPSTTRFELLRPFVVPFKLIKYPIVVWASFVYSGAASIFLITNLTQSEVFAAPPYNFPASSVGYTNFATFTGITIGMLTGGPFSDWLCAWSTRRNNGVREAEMRLPALIPFAVLSTIGVVMMCVGYQNQWPWPVMIVIGYVFIGIQTSTLNNIATTYAVDCYRPVTGDIFVLASIVKDLWAYGVTIYLPRWIGQTGYITPIMVTYVVCLGPCVLAVPMYFFGKNLRKLTRNSYVHEL
jgi:MFS family permease